MDKVPESLQLLLLRLATVLPVMLVVLLLKLRMPVTCCGVLEVVEVEALRLFAVLVLPMVLLAIVFVLALI